MSTFAMHVAKTGLNSQQIKMQVIANNLANVNTTGFKADRANFESLLYQILRGAGENTSENTSLTSGLSVGTGTRLLNTNKLFTQGSLIDTGNSLDMSVEGDGFFQVLMPDGRIGYTRSGAFSRNSEGVVTTASGYPLQPEIQIPADVTSINVSSDGYKRNIIAYSSGATYNTSKHQLKSFNVNGKEKITLNTGFLPENFNDVIRQLLLSEEVWIIEGSDVLPVKPISNSLDFKTSINDKVINYTLDFEYAFDKINSIR